MISCINTPMMKYSTVCSWELREDERFTQIPTDTAYSIQHRNIHRGHGSNIVVSTFYILHSTTDYHHGGMAGRCEDQEKVARENDDFLTRISLPPAILSDICSFFSGWSLCTSNTYVFSAALYIVLWRLSYGSSKDGVQILWIYTGVSHDPSHHEYGLSTR